MNVLTGVAPGKLFICSDAERLVDIAPDGTVTVHREGADKEAARIFYEFLQIEGQTLHQRIERLRAVLQRYARHDELCNLRLLSAHPVKCTCGLYLALAGEVEARPMMSADGGKDIPL